MTKSLVLILLLVTFGISILHCQSGYYITSEAVISGVDLISGSEKTKSRLCQVKQGKIIFQYTPYDIQGYGFENGNSYLSRDIVINDSTQKVFLERLVSGSTTLYYYRGKKKKAYFLEKDSSIFVELIKHDRNQVSTDFNKILLDLTSDCQAVAEASKLVSFNKKSLSRLITNYNNCELKPFPFFKFGIIFGYGINKLSVPADFDEEYMYHFDYKYDGGFIFGLFIDKPLLASALSLHAETYLAKHGYSLSKYVEGKDLDLVANTATFNLPILLRYTFPTLAIRPFINAGFKYAFCIKNENAVYEATRNQNIVEINTLSENSLISRNQLGFALGCGLDYKLSYKHSLFLEIRYGILSGISGTQSLDNSEIQFTTGINF